MTRAYVSIGSNIRREYNIRLALRALEAKYGPLVVSPVYDTVAIGFDGANFLNAVVGLDTDCKPPALVRTFKRLERVHGRHNQDGGYNARTLDLDLLTWGTRRYDDGRIHLPRAEILRHAFVLRPLADIAGDTRHPIVQRCYTNLWAAFDTAGQTMRQVSLDAAA